MRCKKCGSTDIKIDYVQIQRNKRGCIWGLITLIPRMFLGLVKRLLFMKKKKKFNQHKYAVCQNCGHSWKMKGEVL